MADRQDQDADGILLEFAVEPVHDQATLERYLRAYPHLTDELVDLALDLRLQRATEDTTAPSDDEWVEASWASFDAIAPSPSPSAAAVDPFAPLSSAELVALRRKLDVPSGVIEGFRTRIVDLATVPERFLDELARGLQAAAADLRAFMTAPPRLAPGLSYKSDAAPVVADARISFEQLLVQCRVSDERRRLLLAETN